MTTSTNSLFIGLFSENNIFPTETVSSLMRTQKKLLEEKIPHEFSFLVNIHSDVSKNILIASFLKTNHTHMLLCNSNVVWQDDTINKLLGHNVDVVGTCVPFTKYNWELLGKDSIYNSLTSFRTTNNQQFLSKVLSSLLTYNVDIGNNREIKNSLMTVDYVSANFLLIRRNVIDELIKKCDTFEIDGTVVHNVFNSDIVDNKYISSDYVLCKNIRDCGFNINIDVNIPLSTVSNNAFMGHFASTLVASVTQTPTIDDTTPTI